MILIFLAVFHLDTYGFLIYEEEMRISFFFVKDILAWRRSRIKLFVKSYSSFRDDGMIDDKSIFIWFELSFF